MNAWLITWEFALPRETPLDKIVAILSSRKSEAAVAEFVQLVYLRSTCSASQMAYYANRPKEVPSKVQKGLLINGILHGDRVLCGSHPCWLYARRVSKLKIQVNEKKDEEVVTWVEPPEYRWKKNGTSEIEVAAAIARISSARLACLSRQLPPGQPRR